MKFNSFIFFCFLAVAAVVTWLLPQNWRRWSLLSFSYVFYGSWHWPYLALLFSVAGLNHFGSLWIAAVKNRSRRGAVVIAANMLLLGLFKYLDWGVTNANWFTRTIGFSFEWPIPKWVLPLGISFYVFEAISYTIDVIRKREKPHTFWEFQLFIAFFPKLIAGPIMRAKELLPQFAQRSLRPKISDLQTALWLFASGLLLKVVLANDLGAQVDEAFARSPSSFSAVDVWLLAVAFGLQIYFDFSSYTRMAIGSAKLFGVDLVENFNYPYSAHTPVEFWNRWHMSLSRWIRDYLFFPLLGSKPDVWSMCRAALISMTVCGVWHGAGWTYVLWGFYHGLLICAAHLLTHSKSGRKPAQPVQPSTGVTKRLRTIVAVLLTFSFVSLGWILFRSQGLTQAFELLSRAAQPWRYNRQALGGSFYAEAGIMLLFVWLAPGFAAMWRRVEEGAFSGVFNLRAGFASIVQGAAIGVMLVLAILFFHGQTEFIYFQF